VEVVEVVEVEEEVEVEEVVVVVVDVVILVVLLDIVEGVLLTEIVLALLVFRHDHHDEVQHVLLEEIVPLLKIDDRNLLLVVHLDEHLDLLKPVDQDPQLDDLPFHDLQLPVGLHGPQRDDLPDRNLERLQDPDLEVVVLVQPNRVRGIVVIYNYN